MYVDYIPAKVKAAGKSQLSFFLANSCLLLTLFPNSWRLKFMWRSYVGDDYPQQMVEYKLILIHILFFKAVLYYGHKRISLSDAKHRMR